MMKPQPDYINLGFADKMGEHLKALVEKQLLFDLKNYQISDTDDLKFDWSESCIEGHATSLLNGDVENFSGISVFDRRGNMIAHGWMDFIHDKESDYFIAYWDSVRTYEGESNKFLAEKQIFGIPFHVFNNLPESLKENHIQDLIKTSPK